MNSNTTPQSVLNAMLAEDKFTAWLGLSIDEMAEGYCKLHYTITEDMLNGFNTVHGGVLFSASDSAFAFACNSHGRLTVALDVSISFTRPATAGDVLYVTAQEVHLGHKTGVYEVKTVNAEGMLVSLFKGTAYRTSQPIG